MIAHVPAGKVGFDSIISVAFSAPRMLLPGRAALLNLDMAVATRRTGWLLGRKTLGR